MHETVGRPFETLLHVEERFHDYRDLKLWLGLKLSCLMKSYPLLEGKVADFLALLHTRY